MARPTSTLHRLTLQAERLLDHVRPDQRTDYERLTLVPYTSHGNRDRLVLRGRVLANRPLGPATRVEHVHRRVNRMVRRFLTKEVPDVTLQVEAGAATAITTTDDEGYWRVEVEGHGLPADRTFHHVTVTPVDHRDVPVHEAPARVVVPTTRAARLVVTDIDDTIMHSDAFDRVRLYRRTVMGSAWTRQAFAGTGTLFAGLQRGPSLDQDNPVAYLSSSAWNLYDFHVAFLRRSAMPDGPLFLRDMGLDEQRFFGGSHESHKRLHLDELLEVHDLPLVLVGDTGQRDAEIYRDVVADHPERVEAVLLRQVADDRRLREVEAMYADLDVPLVVSPHTTAWAAACEDLGLIAPGWTERVAASG